MTIPGIPIRSNQITNATSTNLTGLIYGNGTVVSAATSEQVRSAADLPSALADYFEAIYLRTTDPEVAGQPWNNGGTLVFSAGPAFSPSMDFSIANNSMYMASFVEEF